MNKQQTHWKKLTNPDYLGSYSLDPGKDLVVKIKSVAKKMVKGANGDEQECIVAQLENQKPMILNKTNCKIIAKLFDSPYIEDWAGKTITLYAEKVKAFGDVVEALRVRKSAPRQPVKETFSPQHEKWSAAVEAIRSHKASIEYVQENYLISEENLELLRKESNA